MAFFKAKFEGKCHYDACDRGGKIKMGEGISWNPKVKPVQYFHEECMMKIKEGRGVKAKDETATGWVLAKGEGTLKVGMKVRGTGSGCGEPAEYKGIVITTGGRNAHVDRGGVGTRNWKVEMKRDDSGLWGSDSREGLLYIQVETPETKKEEKDDMTPKVTGNAGLEKMAELLAPYMRAGLEDGAIEKALKKLDAAVEEARKGLAEAAGAVPRRIEVVRPDGEVKKVDGVHEEFETLLKLINNREHVYLWGPPGSGKSTGAHQVSKALALNYGYISLNPQTPDSRILGYMDAHGTYRTTVFRNMYENGGVMCMDELDNAAPSLCVTINSGLEADHMAFPDGMVDRHKDFVLVATGNTTGRGANPAFPERRPFDAAFAERFVFLEWDYDTQMEKAVTMSINAKAITWLDWVLRVRAHAKKEHPRLIVSPRASFKGAKLFGEFKRGEIAEMVVFKGLDRDTVKSILKAVPLEA